MHKQRKLMHDALIEARNASRKFTWVYFHPKHGASPFDWEFLD